MNANPNPASLVTRSLATLALLTLFICSARAGTHVWSGLGANGNFSNAANWSSGGVPVVREANVILVFPASAVDKNAVQNIAQLGIDQIIIQGDGYFFTATAGNEFLLRGSAAVDIENHTSAGTYFDVSAPIVLNTGEVLIHGTNGTVTIASAISGSGALRIEGPTVELSGSAANTYAGATTLYDGILKLTKPSNINAIPGALNIGHPVVGSPFPLDDVILTSPNQITNNSVVTIHRSGRLLLDNQSDTIGSLEMTGGSVSTGIGNLTLNGNVHVSAPEPEFASIGGVLSLGAQSRIFNVDAGCHLRVSAAIVGNGGIGFIKLGAGSMALYDNASTYSGITSVEAGELSAYGANVTFGTAAAGTLVASGAKLSLSWANIGAESLQLNGDAPGADGAVFTAHGSSSWAGPVTLVGFATNTIHVLTVDMTFSGVISGSGTLRYLGELVNGNYAKLILSGTAANTYSGGTLAEVGLMQLNKTAGVNAIPGKLVIGHSVPGSGTTDATVAWLANQQINDAAAIFILPSGRFNAGNFSETIGSLDMDGGAVDSSAGIITLNGNVTSRGSVNDGHSASISGKLNLGDQTRTFDCLPESSLWLPATISGSVAAGLIKKGIGSLALAGANTYPGVTTVSQGGLQLHSNQALGSTAAGTVVAFDSSLILYSVDIGNEPLQLNGGSFSGVLTCQGESSWAGSIMLNVVGDQTIYPRNGNLTLSGPLTGAGRLRVITEDAKLILTGSAPNTHGGGTLVYSGELVLAKNAGVIAIPGALDITAQFPASVVLSNLNQIADSAAVTMWPGSLLNLNNFSETIGSLAGTGDVATQFATLTTGGNNFTTTFGGTIGGAGFVPLIKEGSGTMLFTGTNYSTSRTLVNHGKLVVHGVFNGAVWVANESTLGGNGFVGNVASTNGNLNPGAGAPGRLHTRNLTADSASTLRFEIAGLVPGIAYDQFSVTGTVTLANCALDAFFAFASTGGEQFILIDNDGSDAVVGTFAGKPEGATFTINGQTFAVSYTGGTGNDVVLKHVNTPPNVTSIATTPFAEEGGGVSLNGIFSDPDQGDAFTLVVNWGDGSAPQTVNLPPFTGSFSLLHTYADDKPGAQASDSFTITYTLTDTSGSPGFGNLNTVIGNVAPSFPAFAAMALKSGETLATTLTFADPGADIWTATVNYGDGSGVQPIVVGAGKSLALNHTFPANGLYTVTVTVNDDDTGSGTTTLEVYVGLDLTITKRSITHSWVRWPAIFTGFALETAPALPAGANWTVVFDAPALNNGQWEVLVTHTAGNAFFRLVKP